MFARTDMNRRLRKDKLGHTTLSLVKVGIFVLFVIQGSSCFAEPSKKYSAEWVRDDRARQLQDLRQKIVTEELDRRVRETRIKAESNSVDGRAWCDYGKAIIELSGNGLDVDTLLKAESPLKKALELDPKSAENHYWLGKYWMYVGIVSRDDMGNSLKAYEAAKRHFTESRKLDPENPRPAKQIALLDRYIERRRDLVKALDKNQVLRKELVEEIKKKDALKSENQSRQEQGGTKDWKVTTNLSLEQEDNLLEMEVGVLNEPDNLNERVRYAKALYRCAIPKDDKLLKKMKEQLDIILEKDKGNLVALSLLGDYYQIKGDVKHAVGVYEEVLKKSGKEPPVETLEGLQRLNARRPLDDTLAKAGNKEAIERLKYVKKAGELLEQVPEYEEIILNYHRKQAEEDFQQHIRKPKE